MLCSPKDPSKSVTNGEIVLLGTYLVCLHMEQTTFGVFFFVLCNQSSGAVTFLAYYFSLFMHETSLFIFPGYETSRQPGVRPVLTLPGFPDHHARAVGQGTRLDPDRWRPGHLHGERGLKNLTLHRQATGKHAICEYRTLSLSVSVFVPCVTFGYDRNSLHSRVYCTKGLPLTSSLIYCDCTIQTLGQNGLES